MACGCRVLEVVFNTGLPVQGLQIIRCPSETIPSVDKETTGRLITIFAARTCSMISRQNSANYRNCLKSGTVWLSSGGVISPKHGYMTCNFTSIFQSYQNDGWVIMKGCVQWHIVYGWKVPLRAGLEHGPALNLQSYRDSNVSNTCRRNDKQCRP